MSSDLQIIINKKKELSNQIDYLMEKTLKKEEEFIQALNNRNEEHAYSIDDEIRKIYIDIHELQLRIDELDMEIELCSPPVKSGDLVDLRAYNNSSYFLICLHGQATEVGSIEYRSYHCSEYLGDIGYRIGEEYRNHGYATEALTLLSEKLYEDGIPDFWISVFEDNIKSVRVIEKSGGKLLNNRDGICLYVVPTKLRDLDNVSETRQNKI